MMKVRSLLSAGALAIAVAGLAAPTLAAADDRPREDGDHRGNPREYPRARDGGQSPWGPNGGPRPAQQQAPVPAPRTNGDGAGGWGGQVRAEQNRRPDSGWKAPTNGGNPAVARNQRNGREQDGSWNRDNNGNQSGAWNRGGNAGGREQWNSGDRGRDPRWSDQRRDGDRDRNDWRDNRDWRDNHNGWRDNSGDNRDRDRDYRRQAQRDNRSWDRGSWRRDDRYDWQRYRDAHRSVYRIGRYSSPYYGYSYRRVSIGFTLGSLFYGNRYWIDDPWYYRLPEVYGPYRWVRYYDDVLLVNVYSGEVVDVIYDFFW